MQKYSKSATPVIQERLSHPGKPGYQRHFKLYNAGPKSICTHKQTVLTQSTPEVQITLLPHSTTQAAGNTWRRGSAEPSRGFAGGRGVGVPPCRAPHPQSPLPRPSLPTAASYMGTCPGAPECFPEGSGPQQMGSQHKSQQDCVSAGYLPWPSHLLSVPALPCDSTHRNTISRSGNI